MRFKVSIAYLLCLALLAGAIVLVAALRADARTIRIVGFGDSLMAGYQLPQAEAFPGRLQAALQAGGYDVEITNAGVSGDTTSDGLARLDWSVPDGVDGVHARTWRQRRAARHPAGADPRESREDDRAAPAARHRGAAGRHAGTAQHGRGLCHARSTRSFRNSRGNTISSSILSFSTAWRRTPACSFRDGMHPNAEGRRPSWPSGSCPTPNASLTRSGAPRTN